MNNKDKKIISHLEENNCISIKLFLLSYCGICSQNILNSKITHDDVRVLFPDLRRVSFEDVIRNIQEVYVGNIILVRDSFGHVAPYLKPKLKEFGDLEIDYTSSDNQEHSNDVFEEAIQLENLSMYELLQLRKKCKEQNKISQYRKICRLIKKRNQDSGIREYHRKKEKILLKGRNKND